MKKRMTLADIHTMVATRKKCALEQAFPFTVSQRLKSPQPLDAYKILGIIEQVTQMTLDGDTVLVPVYNAVYIQSNERVTLDGFQLFYLKSMKDDEVNINKYMESWLNENNK